MARAALMNAIGKLAIAGEEAGFTIEQMIDLLNAGLSVESLLEVIACRLEGPDPYRVFLFRNADALPAIRESRSAANVDHCALQHLRDAVPGRS